MHSGKAKTALITGAGGGIGLAVVRRFAEDGINIAGSDKDNDTLKQAQKIAFDNGVEFFPLPGDLSSASYCDKLPSKVVQQSGRLDIVINNAGIMRRGNILETTDDDWAASMMINVESVFRICRSAIKIMRKNNGGSIVNTASCWGLYPGPDHLVYCTTKGALATMTKCLGRDHAGDGIRVNAVCPNEVNTPMLRTGFERRGFDPASAVRELGKTVPLGRIAEPEDIADTIAFLASDEARYITGTTVEVNGGKPVY